METSLMIIGLQSNIKSTLNITNHTEKASNTSKILSFLVKTKCILQNSLSLEVLGPPFE